MAQHAAAVRVLSDYDLPRLGFSEFLEPAYGASQYLSVYGLARLLAPAFGAVVAIKLVLAGALVSIPYALRALLQALHKPAALALLCLPLTFNAHVVLGFVHFVAGVPCMLFGLALAARLCRAPSIGAKLGLAAVGVLCFYTHVVPYAMLCLGALLLGVSRSPARTFERLLPLGASVLCALWWLRVSPSGATLRQLGRSWVSATLHEDRSTLRSLEELPVWLTDVFGARFDDISLAVWALLMIAVLLSGWTRAGGRARHDHPLAFRLCGLIFVAWFAYFTLPAAYAFIWPIHARFPLLAMLLAIAVLPRISARLQWLIGAPLTALSLLTSWNVTSVLREIERTEYAGLSTLIEAIPEGSRVAGLIYGARSAYVRFAPYLHAVAWYQAERGGIVMFTFAEFPSSPFRFREQHRPPRVPERWEWLPQWVDTERELDFYDWALLRGGPAVLPGFALHQRRGAWSVWRHIHEGVAP